MSPHSPVVASNDIELSPNESRLFRLGGIDLDGETVGVSITAAPLHGTLFTVNSQGDIVGELNVSSLPVSIPFNKVVYVPDFYYVGSDTFGYSVSDGVGGTDVQTISIDTIASTVATIGDDVLVGTSASETLYGADGDDILFGGGNNDTLEGGDGDDLVDYRNADGAIVVNLSVSTPQFISPNHGTDTLIGIEEILSGDHDDVLTGNGADNFIDGGDGDDTIVGGGGNDALVGGDHNDTLQGGVGADTLSGGSGDNVFRYAAGDSAFGQMDIIEDFDPYNDKIEFIGMTGVEFELNEYSFTTNISTTIAAIAANSSLDNKLVFIPQGNNGYLYINADANPFDGTLIKLMGVYQGLIENNFIGLSRYTEVSGTQFAFFNSGLNDIITGSASDDTITISSGNAQQGDSIDLGAGSNDALYLREGGNTISVSNIEDVYGGDGDDTIIDLAGANKLNGGAGQDYIDGGAGFDVFEGGAGSDKFFSNVGGGLDTLSDFDWASDQLAFNIPMSDFSYVTSLNALVKTDTAQGFIFAAGSGMDDTNFAISNQGNGAGDIKSNMNDTAATLSGSTNSDYLLLAGTTTGRTASGDAGNDRIQDISNNANILNGGAGADVLIGSAGSDTIDLGSDSDVDRVVYRAISDAGTAGDTVTNFGASDLIVFTDVANATILTLLDRDEDGNLNDEKAAITSSFTANYATKSIFVINPAAATTSDASDLEEAAAAISGLMTSSSGHSSGRTSIFVVGSGASLTGVYTHVDSNGDGIVTDDELSILAIVNGAVLSTSNFGGTSNDQTFIGTGGNDTISGGIDDDTFIVSTGTDIFYTGGGYDVMDFTGTHAGSTKFDIRGVELIGTDLKFTYTAWDSVAPTYSVTVGGHLASGFGLDQVSFDFEGGNETFDVATTFSGALLTNNTAFAGTSGHDTITGGSGDDILLGNAGDDLLNGGAGDDYLVGGTGHDVIDGGSNSADGDTISFFSSTVGVQVDLSLGIASDGIYSDIVRNIENIVGSDHQDDLIGNSGDNAIKGGLGSDTLTGGAGNDRFIYDSEEDSGVSSYYRDSITDFNAGTSTTHNDLFDISALVQGNFSFNGTGAFTADAGNTHARFESNGDGQGLKLLEIDTDGYATADMQIQLDSNFDAANLDITDFKHTNT